MKTHDLIELTIDSLNHAAKINAARLGESDSIYHEFAAMRCECYMLASTIMDHCPEAMPSNWLVLMKQIRGDEEDVVATEDHEQYPSLQAQEIEGHVAGGA